VTVTESGGIVSLGGTVSGLKKSATDEKTYGIHVHTGTDCTGGSDSTKYNEVIGGHLLSSSVDGWVWPAPTTYTTDADGKATIDVSAESYSLTGTEDTQPGVKDHCIVLHGTSDDGSPRVGIAKISTEVYTAIMGPYPGYSNTNIIPSGTVTVTESGGIVSLGGTVSGLKKSATDEKTYGIHVHTGTDCTGGSDSTKYNEVIGGHLLSSSVDGWVWPAPTTYTTDADGKATIDVSAESYSLTGTEDTQPGVKDHCIVLHGTSDDGSPRVGIAKIIEDQTSPKPTPDPGTNGAYIGMGGFLPLFFTFIAACMMM